MGGYVQVRIASGSNIGGQVSHDCRKRKPAYVQGESKIIMLVYKGDSDVYMDSQCFDIHGDNDATIKYAQKHIKDEMQQRIICQKLRYKEQHNKNMPKTSNHFFKGIITFSHEDTVGEISNEKERKYLDRCAEMYLQIIDDEYGVSPVYLARHEDETTVHYHFVVENFEYEKARTVQRALSRGQFSKMQDLVGEAFEPERYQRGEPKFITRKNHVPFQEWERQQIAKANVAVIETAQIVKNTKSDIVELKTMQEEATNELLEILKLIVAKEEEIEEFKDILGKYKEVRKLFIESHSASINESDVLELRKIEEVTGKTRKVLSGFKSELKELKDRRDEILNGVESKEEKIEKILANASDNLEEITNTVRKSK